MVLGACILVFGVPGVGKTASCEAFAARHPEFIYEKASVLLANAKHASPEELRTAETPDVRSNQVILAEALRRFRRGRLNRPVLVDAHAVIDNDYELVAVPCEAIGAMDPDGLVLLQAPANVVALRRARDARVRPVRSIEHISREIDYEREAVTAYARILGIPVETEEVTNDFDLDPAITSLCQRMAR